MIHLRLAEMLAVCEEYANGHSPLHIPVPYEPSGERVIPEPYIPQIPMDYSLWNGVLVLATAQNLAGSESTYRAKLIEQHNRRDYRSLCMRLNMSYRSFPGRWDPMCDAERHLDTPIGPWKGGLIPFTVAAVANAMPNSAVACPDSKDLMEPIRRVMVSNAVVWSRAKCNSKALNQTDMDKIHGPTTADITDSIAFWTDMLSAMGDHVREIWTFGKPAADMAVGLGLCECRLLHMPFPCQMNLGRLRAELDSDAGTDPTLAALLAELQTQLQIANGNKTLALCCAAVAVKRYREYLESCNG